MPTERRKTMTPEIESPKRTWPNKLNRSQATQPKGSGHLPTVGGSCPWPTWWNSRLRSPKSRLCDRRRFGTRALRRTGPSNPSRCPSMRTRRIVDGRTPLRTGHRLRCPCPIESSIPQGISYRRPPTGSTRDSFRMSGAPSHPPRRPKSLSPVRFGRLVYRRPTEKWFAVPLLRWRGLVSPQRPSTRSLTAGPGTPGRH